MSETKRQAVFDALKQTFEEELKSLEDQESEHAQSLKHLILTIRFLPKRSLSTEGEVAPGSIVKVTQNGVESCFVILPQVKPMVVHVEGKPFRVVSQYSALAHRFMGQTVGFQWEEMRITSVE